MLTGSYILQQVFHASFHSIYVCMYVHTYYKCCDNVYCLITIHVGTVIGAIALMGFYVNIDRAHNTIGFWESQCECKLPHAHVTSTFVSTYIHVHMDLCKMN